LTSRKSKTSVEDIFYLSWSRLEVFFSFHERKHPIIDLIAQLREEGYDRRLHVGRQLHAFVLSRSLNHVLRPEQPRLILELQTHNALYVWYYRAPDVKIELDVTPIELTPALEALLMHLVAHPID